MDPYRTDLPIIYLKPGEMHVSSKPSVVTTVLGSCVAITLHCRRIGAGAICHALLPYGDCGSEGLKYVNCSIQLMIRRLAKYGTKQSEIEAKLFGGSDILSLMEGSARKTIGRQNIEMAQEILKTEGIHLIASNVGGTRGRKLFFYTHTGEVLLKHHRRNGAVVDPEL